MDKPGNPKSIRVSQGIHLVLDRKFFPAKDALMIPKTSDGRVLFALPWHNKVLLGTTDTPVHEISLEPTARQEEINFILERLSLPEKWIELQNNNSLPIRVIHADPKISNVLFDKENKALEAEKEKQKAKQKVEQKEPA